MALQKRLIALDYSFLLLLGAGESQSVDAYDRLDARNFGFIATDTTLQELAGAIDTDEAPFTGQFAHNLIPRLGRDFGIQTPGHSAAKHRIALEISKKLRIEGLLRDSHETEALVIAEASLLGCQLLLTCALPLLGLDSRQINLALIESDALAIEIVDSAQVIRRF